MSQRLTDVLYFGIFVAVVVVGYQVSQRGQGASETRVDIDFSLPPVALPEPAVPFPEIAFAFRQPRIEGPPVAWRPFADEMESALRQVRSTLLTSALPEEVATSEGLVGSAAPPASFDR